MKRKKQINIILVIIITVLLVIIVIIIAYIGRYRADAVRCIMSDNGGCVIRDTSNRDISSESTGDRSGSATITADCQSHIYLGGEYRCSGTSSVVYGYADKAGLTTTTDEFTFKSELWVSAAGNRGRVLNVCNHTVKVTLVPQTSSSGLDATNGVTLVIAPGTFKKFSFSCDNVTEIEVTYETSSSGENSLTESDDNTSAGSGTGLSGEVENGSNNLIYRIYSEDEQYGGKLFLKVNVEWNYEKVKNLGAYYCIFKFYGADGRPLIGLHDCRMRNGRKYKSLGYPVPVGVELVYDEQYYQDFGIRVPYEEIKDGYGSYSREEVKAFFYRVFVCDNIECKNPIYTYKSSLIQIYP